MIFPKISLEEIEIKNLLVIDSLSATISDLAVVVGPQASGKSILAKSLFFFRSYLRDMFRTGLDPSFRRPAFNTEKLVELERLFPNGFHGEKETLLSWKSGDLWIQVTRSPKFRKGRIKISPALEDLFKWQRTDFLRYVKVSEEKDDQEFLQTTRWAYEESTPERSTFARSIPGVLFVPASRAFFSFIQSEVFTLLSAQQSLDRMMAEFGRFYNFARDRFDPARTRNRPSLLEQKEKFERVIGGEFIRRIKKDLIRTEWGEVPLPNSSSGQQEALPLLLALTGYPNSRRLNDLLIVEEPEAHLFPNAQRDVLELIVAAHVRTGCKIVFTTHSPYMIACLNNEILRRDLPARSISAFFLEHGKIESLYKARDRFIDVGRLDEVSGAISDDFFDLRGKNE